MKNKRPLLVTIAIVIGIPLILFFIFFRPDMPLEELKEKYATGASQFVEVDGLKVHYRDEGKGIPLVLVHGTSSSLHTWDSWTELLSDHFRIVRMDLPAFGLTGPNKNHDYSVEAYMNFMDAFLDELDIKSCYMAGNSLGGLITWQYARHSPERVKKIILIDPSGYPMSEIPFVFKLARTPGVNSILKYATPRFFISKNIHEVYSDDSKITDELIDRYYDLVRREGNRDAFIARANLDFDFDASMVKEVKQRCLVQWGADDIWIPVKYAHQFHSDMPKAVKRIYKNVGHVPMEEIPEETARDALWFLTDKSNKDFVARFDD